VHSVSLARMLGVALAEKRCTSLPLFNDLLTTSDDESCLELVFIDWLVLAHGLRISLLFTQVKSSCNAFLH
jgi:hypothetical protein